MKKGSALIMVIWTIAVLSVIVMSFAVEAKLQSAVNVYMRERARMDRLVDAGKVLAEMVIAKYSDAQEYSEDEDLDELLEDDRWLLQKRQLKQTGASATIGPIAIDEQNPEDGSVTVVIESVGGGEGGGPKFNINTLYPAGNPHYAEIWENILYWAGVPEDDHEYFVNAWLDWRDEDDAKKGEYGDNIDRGSEKEYYEEICKDAKEEVYKPRNGPIPDIKELAKIGPFRAHPGLLTGGVYNPEAKEEDQIVVSNLTEVLTVFGGSKINVNTASKSVLMCIPGIRSTEDPEETEDAELISQAIMDWRNGLDMDGNEVNLEEEENGTLIKDFAKLQEITSGEIDKVADEYLGYTGGTGDGALYRLTFTAQVMGMKHVVKAKMTIKDNKPVYLEWQEDP
ncbi:MAG: type II secretion system protein GspK [Kiritimatiellia bacterium]